MLIKIKNVNCLGIVWVVFVCTLSFSSCAGEDNEESGSQEELSEKLLGHWKQEEREGNYYYCEILTFLQDGTYEVKWREETSTGEEGGTYSYDVSFSELDGSYDGNYIIDDHHISIRGEAIIAGEYTIESMSANSGGFVDEDGWKLYLSK